VTDADGRPAVAELSVGVVDEAVYGVKPDETPDPLRFFHHRDWSRVATHFSRQYWFVGHSGREQLLLTQRRRPLGLADFKGEPPRPEVRKEFPDAIHWLPALRTDDDGIARVAVAYPDSLTTWRLTVRGATADTRVGAVVARTTTTKDLIARVVAPRFFTEGDQVSVPVVVHNYQGSEQAVTLSLSAEGASRSPAGEAAGFANRPVAAGGDARFDWSIVADRPGETTLTASAVAGAERDAVAVSLPVLPYGLKRQTGASGTLAGSGERTATLLVPATAHPAARTLRITLAPSMTGSLLGALDFLTSYPYGCTEQILSSFVPNLLVTRTLAELKIAPTERLNSLNRQVENGLRRLYEHQHEDGGWGWWKADASSPFMTAYALSGLVAAEQAGYRVDPWRTRQGWRAVVAQYRTWPRAIPDLKAYLVSVLAAAQASPSLADQRSAGPTQFDFGAALDELWRVRARMTDYGRALLLQAMTAHRDARTGALAGELRSAAASRGDLTWWPVTSDPLLGDLADSTVEATAQAVKALAGVDAGDPLIEQAVRWLLLNRNFGRYWSSTKQTALALDGLLQVMRARREADVELDVEVFVNGTRAGAQALRTTSLTAPDPIVIEAPARGGPNEVRLVSRGRGTVYWTAEAEYVDRIGASSPTGSRKLAIGRQYGVLTPVQRDGRIVYRENPISGPVRPGDLVLGRLLIAGSGDWRFLAVEDPIPAGTEPIARWSLYEFERREAPRWFWDGSRREYRDDRVVLFLEQLGGGRAELVYQQKVTTPGVFQVRPAQVTPMYVPGVSASSESFTLTVAGSAVANAGAK
jgi:uncharacterized protein YfaS (alpha-2-macroglobulin family)